VAERVAYRACLRARERGVILRPLGNTIVLMPPLSIRKDEIDHLIEATVAGITEVTEA